MERVFGDHDDRVRAAAAGVFEDMDYETASHHVSKRMLVLLGERCTDKKVSRSSCLVVSRADYRAELHPCDRLQSFGSTVQSGVPRDARPLLLLHLHRTDTPITVRVETRVLSITLRGSQGRSTLRSCLETT
jgi:hypothetical protein